MGINGFGPSTVAAVSRMEVVTTVRIAMALGEVRARQLGERNDRHILTLARRAHCCRDLPAANARKGSKRLVPGGCTHIRCPCDDHRGTGPLKRANELGHVAANLYKGRHMDGVVGSDAHENEIGIARDSARYLFVKDVCDPGSRYAEGDQFHSEAALGQAVRKQRRIRGPW